MPRVAAGGGRRAAGVAGGRCGGPGVYKVTPLEQLVGADCSPAATRWPGHGHEAPHGQHADTAGSMVELGVVSLLSYRTYGTKINDDGVILLLS